MQFIVAAHASVDASHRQGSHQGCGHTWTIDVVVQSRFDPSKGILSTSSQDVHDWLYEFIAPWWNRSLNDMLPGSTPSPEGIAVRVLDEASMVFPLVESVSVKASYGAAVTVRREIRAGGPV